MAVEYGFNSVVLCEVWVSVCVWGGGGGKVSDHWWDWPLSRLMLGVLIWMASTALL